MAEENSCERGKDGEIDGWVGSIACMPQYSKSFTILLLWLNDNTYIKRKKSFHKCDPVKCPTILG